ALAFEGFYTSIIDGDFGPGTRKSMAAWQTARGYDETGILTTSQRVEVLNDYQSVVNAFSFQIVRDEVAGIEIKVPQGLVQKGRVDPPFANYEPSGNSGVRLILISQTGDKSTLYGMYDILQTLDIMPLDGDRAKAESSFSINGKNDKIASHAEAKLTADGIKGFILVWPAGDDRRFAYALRTMQESFAAIDGVVLPDVVSEGGIQDPDLLSGLEIRRADVTRSGFYVDAAGMVLTTTEVAGSCTRLTLDDGIMMTVIASDAASGLALLKADRKMAPLAYAKFRAAAPRLQSDIAVSGFAFDGRLGAPVLTFGKIEDVKGLAGEADLDRLTLSATPSDAGGPVYDSTGAVFGLLLPTPKQSGQVLPAGVAFARDMTAISPFLSKAGISPVMADGAEEMSPEELTRHAADMTVRLACWN
ncbi:MAG: serine protease, partial [Deltaproteobacteria bacterium]